jgi:hypothetical protein
MNLQFECIWKKNSLSEAEQLILFWQRLNTLPSEEVTMQPANNIVFVAKKENEVIGVATVRNMRVKLLNNNYFYEFRTFILPECRTPDLDAHLAIRTKEYFEKNPQVSDFPCIGLIAIVEDEEIRQKRNCAVWPDFDMVFAGYTIKGDHIRVSYFKNARI